jgi:hypothetical protein
MKTAAECRNVSAGPRGYSFHLYTNSVVHGFRPSRFVFISLYCVVIEFSLIKAFPYTI